MCDIRGARCSWLGGFEKINNRYLMQTAAHNLRRMVRALFGIGKPRYLQGLSHRLVHLFVLCKLSNGRS